MYVYVWGSRWTGFFVFNGRKKRGGESKGGEGVAVGGGAGMRKELVMWKIWFSHVFW